MPGLFAAAVMMLAQTSGALPSKSLAARLHHVHVAVPDQALAMRAATSRVDGSVRTILQAHGPGVRKDGQYIVFDREGAVPPASAAGCDASIRAAVAWLATAGVAVPDREFSMAAALRDAPCVTVAFAVGRPADVVEPLRARGIEPTDDRGGEARYRLASGLTVEILEDPDRPDTHWCPMHPDVQAPRPGTCPQCKMDLVPIPAPQVGEYGLDVTMAVAEGQLRFRFMVTEPASARPVTQFVQVHERLFHLFIISADLGRFEHVHPERQPDGSFVLTQALAPGEYVLIADLLPQGGTPQMLQRTILTPGYAGPASAASPRLTPSPLEQRAGDLLVRLSASTLTELRHASLTFDVLDVATGRRAAGLEPFLGAAAHLLVVDEALQLPLHAHPEQETAAADAGIDFDLRFPKAGVYKLWFQFQRNGQVHTIPFVVRVAPM